MGAGRTETPLRWPSLNPQAIVPNDWEPEDTPFSFEHVFVMTERDFVRFTTVLKHSRRGLVRMGLVAALAVAALFWRYTAGIGVVVLLLLGCLWMIPLWSRRMLHTQFAERSYLHGPVTYGVSSRGFWLRAEHLSTEANWEALLVWREVGNWLILSAGGMPAIYLPRSDLREAGLYEPVKKLAILFGREFGSKGPPAHTASVGPVDGYESDPTDPAAG
jgi:hypothetical protein